MTRLEMLELEAGVGAVALHTWGALGDEEDLAHVGDEVDRYLTENGYTPDDIVIDVDDIPARLKKEKARLGKLYAARPKK